jgi:hypothetical protein
MTCVYNWGMFIQLYGQMPIQLPNISTYNSGTWVLVVRAIDINVYTAMDPCRDWCTHLIVNVN